MVRIGNESQNKMLRDKSRSILIGGLYWTRTSDPIDVNDVLYQLSQQTVLCSVNYDTTRFCVCPPSRKIFLF